MNSLLASRPDRSTRDADGGDDTERLAMAAAGGCADSLGELYDRHMESTYRFALSRLGGDAATAQDVTQEAWYSVVKQIGQYQTRGQGGGWVAWLFTILRSRISDHYRATNRRHCDPVPPELFAYADLTDEDAVGPEDAALAVDAADAMSAALRVIPAAYAEVLLARFWCDLTLQETAAALGITVSLVKVRQHRGVKALARVLPEGVRNL